MQGVEACLGELGGVRAHAGLAFGGVVNDSPAKTLGIRRAGLACGLADGEGRPTNGKEDN
jgi:hypothetical protein